MNGRPCLAIFTINRISHYFASAEEKYHLIRWISILVFLTGVSLRRFRSVRRRRYPRIRSKEAASAASVLLKGAFPSAASLQLELAFSVSRSTPRRARVRVKWRLIMMIMWLSAEMCASVYSILVFFFVTTTLIVSVSLLHIMPNNHVIKRPSITIEFDVFWIVLLYNKWHIILCLFLYESESYWIFSLKPTLLLFHSIIRKSIEKFRAQI